MCVNQLKKTKRTIQSLILPEFKHPNAFLRDTNTLLEVLQVWPCSRSFAHSLSSWREKGAPTRTYPDQREQSWGSIYTCLPLGPQSNGSGGHFFTRETDSGEGQHKQEEEGNVQTLCFLLP